MSSARAGSCAGGWVDVLFAALAYWYLTGVIALLGFSFGFHLARRSSSNVPKTSDPVFALTWMDAGWYQSIATRGYEVNPHGQSNIAFFPAYPLLGRGVMLLTGVRPEFALAITSNICWVAALVAFAFYVRARFASEPTCLADYAVLAAVVMPAGCFFRLNYSESTFLLFAVLAFNSMARRWPLWLVALIIGMATAARLVGVALVAPLAIHILRGAGQDDQSGETHWPRRVWRTKLLALAIYPTVACWGLGAFMAYQQRAFGDALAAFKAHEHWRIQGYLPWHEKAAVLATLAPIRSVYDPDSLAYWKIRDSHGVESLSLQFANPLYFIAAAGLLALAAWRRWLPLEELVFAALLLLIPYAGRGYEMGMGSTGRFMSVVFPLYVVVGRLLLRLPGPLRAAVLSLSGAMLCVYTALYAAGYEIF